MRDIRPGPAVVAVALVAAGVLFAAGRPATPAAVGVPTAGRRPAQRTLSIGPGTGFAVLMYATDTTQQQLWLADPALPTGGGTAEVWAYDPGTFDTAAVSQGRPVIVAGHDAVYLADPVPTVAWRTGSGTWITVTGGVAGDALVALARSVRLGPPVPVTGPVGLTWLPGGLSLSSAQIGEGSALLVFSARGRRSYEVRLTAYAVDSNEWTTGTIGLGNPTATIAGRPAWYAEQPDGHSQLLLEAGSCGLRVQVSDHRRVPFGTLARMLTGARVGGCDGVGNWLPVLP